MSGVIFSFPPVKPIAQLRFLLLDFQHCYIVIVSFTVQASRVFSILCVPVRLCATLWILVSIVSSYDSVFILVNFPYSPPVVSTIIYAHHFAVVILRLLWLLRLLLFRSQRPPECQFAPDIQVKFIVRGAFRRAMQIAHVYGNGVAVALDYADGFFQLELGEWDGFPSFTLGTFCSEICKFSVLLIIIPSYYLAPIKAVSNCKIVSR